MRWGRTSRSDRKVMSVTIRVTTILNLFIQSGEKQDLTSVTRSHSLRFGMDLKFLATKPTKVPPTKIALLSLRLLLESLPTLSTRIHSPSLTAQLHSLCHSLCPDEQSGRSTDCLSNSNRLFDLDVGWRERKRRGLKPRR